MPAHAAACTFATSVHRAPRKRRTGHKHKHKRHHAHKRTARHRTSPSGTADRQLPEREPDPKPSNIEASAPPPCAWSTANAPASASAALHRRRPTLASAATGHTADMDAHDYFEHIGPSGETPLIASRQPATSPAAHVGYTSARTSRGARCGLATPHAIVKAWMASPGHRANILNGSYRYTGDRHRPRTALRDVRRPARRDLHAGLRRRSSPAKASVYAERTVPRTIWLALG